MENELNLSAKENYTASPTQIELLEELESCAHAPYPWDTTDPASEAYFVEREQEFLLSDFFSEAEIVTRSQSFFTQIEQIWSNTAPVASLSTANQITEIQTTLAQRFAESVPQSWLNAIAQKAQQVFTTQKSTADKLVQCVQDLLPSWAKEDLVVLARPYAYAMRGKETDKVKSVVDNLRDRGWQKLSEIEQARVAIAIAHCTLTEIQNILEHEENGL